MFDVRYFVDEAARPVQAEDCNDTRRNLRPKRSGQNRERQRGIADQCRQQEIGPVNAWIGRVEIARQLGGRADHRHIIGGPLQPFGTRGEIVAKRRIARRFQRGDCNFTHFK